MTSTTSIIVLGDETKCRLFQDGCVKMRSDGGRCLVFSNRRRLAPRIGLSRDEASNDGHSFSTFLSLLTRDMILSSQYCFLTSLFCTLSSGPASLGVASQPDSSSLQRLVSAEGLRERRRNGLVVSEGFGVSACRGMRLCKTMVSRRFTEEWTCHHLQVTVQASSHRGCPTRYTGQRSRLVGRKTELSSGKSNETTA
jgi:hypothetical protein